MYIFVSRFSDLTYDILKGQIFVCAGVEYLTFDILLHVKSEQKAIIFSHQK